MIERNFTKEQKYGQLKNFKLIISLRSDVGGDHTSELWTNSMLINVIYRGKPRG